MVEILDRAGGLALFSSKVEIDYTLPKYNRLINSQFKKSDKGKIEEIEDKYSNNLRNYIKSIEEEVADSEEKRRALMKSSSGTLIDAKFFEELDAEGLITIIDNAKTAGLRRGEFGMFYEGWGDVDTMDQPIPNRIFSVSNIGTPLPIEEVKSSSSSSIKTSNGPELPWWKRALSGIRKKKVLDEDKPKSDEEPEPVYALDVLAFFDMVKLKTQENAEKYYSRIEPYLVALKNAQTMGQQALADQILSQIFIVKYESLLKVSGFEKRITEEQLVSFVKQTEKGVSLCYVKNFSRPIPEDVMQKKIEADSLKVFDNYCVLHFDPDAKVYKMTAEEKQELRRKKNDPILFGVISGSRSLYYIADWKDEYCDLTLEKFIQISGIKEKCLGIDEKVKI